MELFPLLMNFFQAVTFCRKIELSFALHAVTVVDLFAYSHLPRSDSPPIYRKINRGGHRAKNAHGCRRNYVKLFLGEFLFPGLDGQRFSSVAWW